MKKRKLSTLFLILFLLVSVGVGLWVILNRNMLTKSKADNNVVYFDDFSQGDRGWVEKVVSNYRGSEKQLAFVNGQMILPVNNQRLAEKQSPYSFFQAPLSPTLVPDFFALEADFGSLAPSSFYNRLSFYLGFGIQGNSYYGFHYNRVTKYLQIYRSTGGTAHEFFHTLYTKKLSDKVHLSVQRPAGSNQFSFFIDNNLVYQGTLKIGGLEYVNGGVGVLGAVEINNKYPMASDYRIWVDNFKVTDLAR